MSGSREGVVGAQLQCLCEAAERLRQVVEGLEDESALDPGFPHARIELHGAFHACEGPREVVQPMEDLGEAEPSGLVPRIPPECGSERSRSFDGLL